MVSEAMLLRTLSSINKVSGTTLPSAITFNKGEVKVAMYNSMHVHMLYILNMYGLARACLGMYMYAYHSAIHIVQYHTHRTKAI